MSLFSCPVRSQTAEATKPVEWKPVSFAIVRFNDEAPASWNIYHTSKRGVLLVKLWKRYLLVNVPEHQVFDIDPDTNVWQRLRLMLMYLLVPEGQL